MRTTERDTKVSDKKTLTLKPLRFADSTTSTSDTPSRDTSPAGTRPRYVTSSHERSSDTDGSTWGWARMMLFDRRYGFRPIE